jgi:hypothetical protein
MDNFILIGSIVILIFSIIYTHYGNRKIIRECRTKINTFDKLFQNKTTALYRDQLASWQVNDLIDKAVRSVLEDRIVFKIQDEAEDLVERLVGERVRERLSVVSSEMAEKYTFENFESQIKSEMAKRLAMDIRQNLLANGEGE